MRGTWYRPFQKLPKESSGLSPTTIKLPSMALYGLLRSEVTTDPKSVQAPTSIEVERATPTADVCEPKVLTE